MTVKYVTSKWAVILRLFRPFERIFVHKETYMKVSGSLLEEKFCYNQKILEIIKTSVDLHDNSGDKPWMWLHGKQMMPFLVVIAVALTLYSGIPGKLNIM